MRVEPVTVQALWRGNRGRGGREGRKGKKARREEGDGDADTDMSKDVNRDTDMETGQMRVGSCEWRHPQNDHYGKFP